MAWPFTRKTRRTNFDGAPMPIDRLFADMLGRSGSITVTRARALRVPAMLRGRNLICSVATLPLVEYGPQWRRMQSPLLQQIDPDVADVVTLAMTVEDLLFDGVAWWLKTATDPNGFPIAARHLHSSSVSLHPPRRPKGTPSPLPSGIDPRDRPVYIDGVPVASSRVIRFDSPNPGVLEAARDAIARAILLDSAARMYADDPRPLDYFTPTEGADPADDDDVAEILSKWKAARKARTTGYVPASLNYHTVSNPTPADLQLNDLQRTATLDLANALSVDPEDLGVSTTSRTYANAVDRRRDRINDVLAPYMRAITDRLTMGDVTKPGRVVHFDLNDYMKSNPTERWSTYSTAVGMDAMTVDEVRDEERRPPLPPPPPPPPAPVPPAPAEQETPMPDQPAPGGVDAARVTPTTITFDGLDVAAAAAAVRRSLEPQRVTFAETHGLTFVNVPTTEFSVNREGRVIEGLVLPYGQIASKGGLRFRFEPGSLRYDVENPGRVKLLRDHDYHQPIGRAIQLRDTAAGVLARFKVARGAEGNRALELAEDGVLDGFSVGVDFDAATDTVPDDNNRGVLLVRRADWRETSLTAMPSFDNARVTSVAASRTAGGAHVPEANDNAGTDQGAGSTTTTTTDAGPAGVQLSQEQLAVLLAAPGALEALTRPAAPAAAEPEVPAGGLILSADQVQGLVASGALGTLLGIGGPAAPAEPEPVAEAVDATRTPVHLSVTDEALPYRFDRGGNFVQDEHVFSADLHEMAQAHDFDGSGTDAGRRVMGLLRRAFDTDTADVASLNPTLQRPDMYVDQRDYKYPIWESINKGAPPNGVQPFMFPKFGTASGLVGDHVQAVEPVAGTMTATNQTVTPTPISGKASITREVWDMGGNPAVSTLIFNQMLRGWREGLETASAAFLNTLTAATDIALGVGVVDGALADAWDQALAGLQFVRGYDFEMFAIEQVLYKAFVDAADTTGRKLFPIITPTNANGQSTSRFRQLDLSGVVGVPGWGLASTPGALNNSWLFDPTTVFGWASPPTRLEFPGTNGAVPTPVATVDLAIWGYKAFANSDIGGVRQVTYDSVV